MVLSPQYAGWRKGGIFRIPETEVGLRRDHFGMHRMTGPDDPAVEFHLGHGDWIRLLSSNDLIIEDLIELRPDALATTTVDLVTVEWARRWPAEEAWKARKRT
jgi:hypothetical protein